jgi:F0F1-type ATP synthase membrane subunit c/vacuolar-type H+-ATPase subunit K
MKNVIPVVMAGGTFFGTHTVCAGRKCAFRFVFLSLLAHILTPPVSVIGIYGLIVGVILAQSIDIPSGSRENVYSIYSAMAHVSPSVSIHPSVLSFFLLFPLSWVSHTSHLHMFLYSLCTYVKLAAGLCCGLSGLVAGGCIGIVGDFGVRSVGYRASQITLFPSASEKEGYSQIPEDHPHDHAGGGGDDLSGSDDQNKLFVGMLIMLIFSEALAL